MDLIVINEGDDIEAGMVEPMTAMEEEKLYVAVGKEVIESESTLLWAIQNSGGRTISILHVHQPDNFIPILGKKYHWSSLEEQQVKTYRAIERQLMLKTLDEYIQICRQFGLRAEKHFIEMDSIENGILQLIARHKVEKLVMGAAADDSYHKKMMEPKSKKAVFLQLYAPASCHIWFICKGRLIHEREGSSQMRTCAENERITNSRSLSMPGQSNQPEVSSQEAVLLREGSSHFGASNGRVTVSPWMDDTEVAPVSRPHLDLEADCLEILRSSRSRGSDVLVGSSPHLSRESTDDLLEMRSGQSSEQIHLYPFSPPTIAQEKSCESLYIEEVKKRKELEEELEKVKNELNGVRKELLVAIDQKLALESRVANYDQVLKDMEEGMVSNVQMLRITERERDDLKMERDNALKTTEELLNQSADAVCTADVPRLFATFTFAEIKEATNHFDPSLQLSEHENGSVYKGVIGHTQVIIKIWPSEEGLQGPRDFHQEVEILSKFRHPNIVTLMGVCPEALALVYEYLPNGSLEERLRCKDNTPPLSWQTRIRIATELCSALIFLHSRMPQRVVHGTLRPAAILLDSNFSCKISDFRFSHLIPHEENSLSTVVSYSSEYTDPEFFEMEAASPAMDIYPFGLILLELLTGKSAFGLRDVLVNVLDGNGFEFILDASAGNWPFLQAEQLARLALRCYKEDVNERPDLNSDIWRIIEPMRASCGASPMHHLGDDEEHQAPSYFICPIFQEVMKDPHVAADGYTYEAEALRGWLDTGHNTSPMTNLQLENCNLVPNHALRSAIQEWREQHHHQH